MDREQSSYTLWSNRYVWSQVLNQQGPGTPSSSARGFPSSSTRHGRTRTGPHRSSSAFSWSRTSSWTWRTTRGGVGRGSVSHGRTFGEVLPPVPYRPLPSRTGDPSGLTPVRGAPVYTWEPVAVKGVHGRGRRPVRYGAPTSAFVFECL